MNPNEIAASHRSRLAFIYVRQSSQHQVLDHLESQRRQRSLHERAVDLGWKRDLITVITDPRIVDRILRHLESPACKVLDPF
jgi:hypothetical protein